MAATDRPDIRSPRPKVLLRLGDILTQTRRTSDSSASCPSTRTHPQQHPLAAARHQRPVGHLGGTSRSGVIPEHWPTEDCCQHMVFRDVLN